MPRAVSRPNRDAGKIYVAWQSAAVGALGGTVIRRGARFHGDSREVRKAPWLFVEADGADEVELEARMRQRAAEEIPSEPRPT